ncbi:hypothetical protein Taro_001141 [Colocasia esculenta]|uniref:GPN-loop GTPase 3 n=1 Tax=Colocasia esculenta TaxID=4460 RepID=A0A843TCR2_COLES|nr:hypothetical protein [Colocasia esculenta]
MKFFKNPTNLEYKWGQRWLFIKEEWSLRGKLPHLPGPWGSSSPGLTGRFPLLAMSGEVFHSANFTLWGTSVFGGTSPSRACAPINEGVGKAKGDTLHLHRAILVLAKCPEIQEEREKSWCVSVATSQIELFTHIPVLRNFVEHLKRKNFNVCAVYLLDSQFVTDVTKYISGCMASLSAMVQLELPHINILSKMDIVTNKKDMENYLNPEARVLLLELNQHMAPQYAKLNKALAELVDEFSMVNFVPLDLMKESSCQKSGREQLLLFATWPDV